MRVWLLSLQEVVMLVLSRKIGEKIVITQTDGKPITVMVVSIERGKVRLGVDAPREVTIYRSEIQDQIDAAKAEAAKATA